MMFPAETPSFSPFVWHSVGVLQQYIIIMLYGKKLPSTKQEFTQNLNPQLEEKL